MGYPVAYLSGNTTTYETGMFKRGTIGQNQAAALTGNYRWWNGIDVTSSQYLIYSDTFTTSASTAANATPAAWATPDLADQSLLNLINTLPERIGKLPFTYLPVALQWIQSTGRYFLLRNGYENIVTNGLITNLDAAWYLSYSGTGTNWKDLSGSNDATLINGPSFSTFSGGSLVFDGTNDYALIPIQNYSSTPTITVEGFIKWESLNGGMFLGFDNNDVWTSSNTLGFNNGQSNVIGISAADVSNLKLVGNFAHYVFVMKQNQLLSTFKMYINTVPQTLTPQVNSDGVSSSFTGNIALASWTRSGGGGFNGNVQFGNLRIYNRELSLSEITQNFNAQKTRFGFTADTIVTSGLTINLDAGSVISYPTTGTSWYDTSYNNYDATLNNGITFSSLSGGTFILDGIDDSISGKALVITSGQCEGDITYEYWVEPQDVIFNGYTESTSGTQFYRPGNSATKQGLQSNLSYLYAQNTNSPYYNTKVALGFALGTNGFVAGVHQNSYAPTILVDYKTITGTKHLVVIKRGNNVTYYLNGVKQKDSLTVPSKTIGDGFGNFTFADGSGGPTQSITAVNNSFTTYYKGNIYSYRVYLRELSQSEITQNYNAQKSRYGL
jgi:hypothetical protein